MPSPGGYYWLVSLFIINVNKDTASILKIIRLKKKKEKRPTWLHTKYTSATFYNNGSFTQIKAKRKT
jgi:hypothetical protein